MGKMIALIRVTFMTKIAYIKAFWFNIFGTAVSILIYYFLWKYVLSTTESLNGFSMREVTTYVILSRVLASQFSGGIDKEFSEWVYKGNIAVELLRPVSLFFSLWSKRLGEFFFFILFKGIPVTIIGMIILKGVAPCGVMGVMLFGISVLVSIMILFWIEIMVGLLSFFTLNSYGVSSAKSALLSILSGGIVPIVLFPERIADFLNYLPFASMVSVPINIYLGKYAINQALEFIILQVAWGIILGIIALVFYRFSIKKVVVQGG